MSYFKLFDSKGRRKFLTHEERKQFSRATKHFSPEIRTLCLILLHTGCRRMEAMNLKLEDVCFKNKRIKIGTILQRKKSNVFRFVPLSDDLLDELNLVHGLENRNQNKQKRIWKWCDRTTLKYVHAVMKKADIPYNRACLRSLRHGFGMHCAKMLIPVHITRRWMGHSDMTATLAYYKALDYDERELAGRVWE